MSKGPLDYDPRGRVESPRPMDRFFYDRDKTRAETIPSPKFAGGFLIRNWDASAYQKILVYENDNLIVSFPDAGRDRYKIPGGTTGRSLTAKGVCEDPVTEPEQREYDRHRTMFWELMADYFEQKRFSPWFDLYYQKTGKTPVKQWDTYWPGYGQSGEGFPFGDTEPAAKDIPPLTRVPGQNVPPKHKSGTDAGHISRDQLDRFHAAFDRTQEAFGAARGCYEVWTDIFVDVTDGFRGGYQNGDTRWIFKTPINEEYKYVEELHEHLYGMKDGWTWTAISGSKERQCAGLGGLNWGRSVTEETYLDYDESKNTKAATKFGDDEHAADRNTDGSLRTDVYERQVGDEAAFGIVVKERMGPIDSEDTWADTEADDYSPKSLHEIRSETKVGGPDGVAVTEKTISDKSGTTPANKIWSETKIGSDVTITEEKTDSALNTTLKNKDLSVVEKISTTTVDTTINGNDKETVHGNKEDYHLGNNFALHAGTSEELFFGGQAELFVGGKVGFALGGWFEIVVGLPVVGAVAGGVAAGVGDGVGGGVGAGIGGGLGAAAEGLFQPTEIFVGQKAEVFVGGKLELGLAATMSICIGHLLEIAPSKTDLLASHTKIVGDKKQLTGKWSVLSPLVDLN